MPAEPAGLRQALVAEARGWIGTPYRHATALRGIGCDCLGLVAGVARHVLGEEAVPPLPAYAPDWAEATRADRLERACDAVLSPAWKRHGGRPMPRITAGDVLLFAWREGRPASHLALATGEGTIVHAHARACIAEVALTPAWRRRLVALYAFAETC